MSRHSLMYVQNELPLGDLSHKNIVIHCYGKSLLTVLTIPVTTNIREVFLIWLITINKAQNETENKKDWIDL